MRTGTLQQKLVLGGHAKGVAALEFVDSHGALLLVGTRSCRLPCSG